MVDIKGTVGDMAANGSDDVALVQLMLRVVKNAKGQPYFPTDYTGQYSPALKTAIQNFQIDQGLVKAKVQIPFAIKDAKAAPKTFGPVIPVLTEKEGVLGPQSKTFRLLNEKLPADYRDIRIMPNTKTIYLAGEAGKAATMSMTIREKTDLNQEFREKIAQLVDTVYQKHKLVLGIPGDGWRRDFQAQANVNPAATGAGPGESAHQFGRAVDIGFANLKWVAGNGQIKTDNFWLASQGLTAAKQEEFWRARNDIATTIGGIYKTTKAGDVIHLQGFEDAKVSWGKSLANLLQTVSPAKAKWMVAGGSPNQYKMDPGLGTYLSAGSALTMWNGTSAISKAELVKALNAKLTVDPAFSVEKFFGAPAKAAPPADPKAAAKPPALTEADIKADYLTTLQKTIQKEMKAADQSWDQWKAVK